MEAVLRQGMIVPLGPLPAEWKDGVLLNVAIADEASIDADAWARSMDELCAESSEDDQEVMRQAIEQHRQQAKLQVRREMGLDE